jgi:hypothetical protein
MWLFVKSGQIFPMLDSTQIEPVFRAAPVDRRTALRAWPLVQISRPDLARERWMSFATAAGRRAGRNGGLICIEDSRGYVHAVFTWAVSPSIEHRRALRVTDLIVGALPGRQLAEAIVAAVRGVADSADAESVTVEIGDRQIAPDALLHDGFEHLVMHCMRSDRPDAPY